MSASCVYVRPYERTELPRLVSPFRNHTSKVSEISLVYNLMLGREEPSPGQVSLFTPLQSFLGMFFPLRHEGCPILLVSASFRELIHSTHCYATITTFPVHHLATGATRISGSVWSSGYYFDLAWLPIGVERNTWQIQCRSCNFPRRVCVHWLPIGIWASIKLTPVCLSNPIPLPHTPSYIFVLPWSLIGPFFRPSVPFFFEVTKHA